MLKLLKKLGKVALTSSLILAPTTQVAFAQESSGEFEGEKVKVLLEIMVQKFGAM